MPASRAVGAAVGEVGDVVMHLFDWLVAVPVGVP
jgi:hypothetical protein